MALFFRCIEGVESHSLLATLIRLSAVTETVSFQALTCATE